MNESKGHGTLGDTGAALSAAMPATRWVDPTSSQTAPPAPLHCLQAASGEGTSRKVGLASRDSRLSKLQAAAVAQNQPIS
jgi:hypothetical protein